MEKNWINDILDEAVKEVQSWPSWMQQGQVRVTEATPNSPKEGIPTVKEQNSASKSK